MRCYCSGKKRIPKIGLLVSFLAAFLMIAAPAADGWAMGFFNRFAPPPPPPPPPPGNMVVDVVGPDGRPMGGVKVGASFVAVVPGTPPFTGKAPTPAGVTGSTGRVQFSNLPAGRWQVAASLPGFKQQPDAPQLVVPPRGTGGTRVQMVPLAPPKVAVVPLTINVITLGGRPVVKADIRGVFLGPLPGAPRMTAPMPAGLQQFHGITGPTGRITFPTMPGKWRLSIVAPDFRPIFNVPIDILPGGGRMIGFQLAGIGPSPLIPPKPIVEPTKPPVSSTTGALNVFVLGSDNRPVMNARVTASNPQPLPVRSGWAVIKPAPVKVGGVTGPDGRILFPNLPPGRYTITAEASGFRAGSASGALNVGQVLPIQMRLVRIAPPPPPKPPVPPVPPKPPVPTTGTGINLTVVSPDNRPVVNARVTAEGLGPTKVQTPTGVKVVLPSRATGVTGPSGTLLLKLSPGSYKVIIEANNFRSANIGASVGQGAPTPVKYVMSPTGPTPKK